MKLKIINISTVAVLSILVVTLFRHYNKTVMFSCGSESTITMSTRERLNFTLKAVVYKNNDISLLVKGTVNKDGESPKILFREAEYSSVRLEDGFYRLTVSAVKKYYTDNAADNLSLYLFGINPGDSREIKFHRVTDDLMMIGTKTAWMYSCVIDH